MVLRIAAHRPRRGMCVESQQGDPDGITLIPIVATQNPDHLAGGSANSLVESAADAIIRFADPVIDVCVVFSNDVDRSVSGAAVDHDVFDVRMCLRDHTLDRALESI